jgi:hypothetical protein
MAKQAFVIAVGMTCGLPFFAATLWWVIKGG